MNDYFSWRTGINREGWTEIRPKTVTFNMNRRALIANCSHVYTLTLNDGTANCFNFRSEIADVLVLLGAGETDWHDLGKSLRHFNWAETELCERYSNNEVALVSDWPSSGLLQRSGSRCSSAVTLATALNKGAGTAKSTLGPVHSSPRLSEGAK